VRPIDSLAASKATDLAIGSVQTVDRSKHRPAGPATAELSPTAMMTVVRPLVTERGGACQRQEARGSALLQDRSQELRLWP
jgi:hypothetical protein